jgi:hypothetical protein
MSASPIVDLHSASENLVLSKNTRALVLAPQISEAALAALQKAKM